MRLPPALLCAILLCAACSEPPRKEIDRAQGAIDAARAAGAAQYAEAEFAAATAALEQAHQAVELRDYRLALSRALDASERAQEAARQAASGKAQARSEAEAVIGTARTSLQQLRSAIEDAEEAKIPSGAIGAARKTAARIDASLQEARARLGAEDYRAIPPLLKDTSTLVSAEIRALNEAAAKPRPPRRRR